MKFLTRNTQAPDIRQKNLQTNPNFTCQTLDMNQKKKLFVIMINQNQDNMNLFQKRINYRFIDIYIIMQPQFRGKKPCKYGQKCNKFRDGHCTFSHDKQDYQGHGNGPKVPGGYETGGGMGNWSHKGGHNHHNNPHHNPQPQTWGGKGSYQQNQQNSNQQYKPQDPIQEFCKFFQMAGECKSKGPCKRIHGFTRQNNLYRNYHNKIVVDKDAILGLFTDNNRNYLTYKSEAVISILEYDFEKNELNLLDTINMENIFYHYISTKEHYFYFAYKNNTNSLINIGYYDIFTKQFILVQNAHQKEVTDLVHITIGGVIHVLSASIDGIIKAWKIGENNQLVYDPNITDVFKQCYNPANNKMEIYFMDRKKIGGMQALVAGTNDGRLLFWIGPQMQFQQAVFPAEYTKVHSVKFVQYQQAWVGIVLVWATDQSKSVLVGLELTQFSPSLLLMEEAKHLTQLITTIQNIGDSLLLVTDMSGIVTIYSIPDFKEKIGFIMHNNKVGNMLGSSLTTSTGINKAGKGNGSLSVYTLKQ